MVWKKIKWYIYVVFGYGQAYTIRVPSSWYIGMLFLFTMAAWVDYFLLPSY